MTSADFVRVYEFSSSVTQASVLLGKEGFLFTPNQVRAVAYALRRLGVRLLKKVAAMPRRRAEGME